MKLQSNSKSNRIERKKAVSPFIAYVLLISMTVALSAVVATWLYTHAKSPGLPTEKCEGVSLTIEKISCQEEKGNKIISATLKNRGRFTIESIYAKADSLGELGEAYRFSLPIKKLVTIPPNSEYEYTETYAKIGSLKRIKFIPFISRDLCSEQSVESITPEECR